MYGDVDSPCNSRLNNMTNIKVYLLVSKREPVSQAVPIFRMMHRIRCFVIENRANKYAHCILYYVLYFVRFGIID